MPRSPRPAEIVPVDRTIRGTRYYADIANSYNRLPLAFEKVDPDLTVYVVGKAVDALFDQIALEEANIRANPLANHRHTPEGLWSEVINSTRRDQEAPGRESVERYRLCDDGVIEGFGPLLR